MNVFVLVVYLLTAQGPQTVRIDAPDQRQCVAAATLMQSHPRYFDDAIVLRATCVHEYAT